MQLPHTFNEFKLSYFSPRFCAKLSCMLVMFSVIPALYHFSPCLFLHYPADYDSFDI